MAVTVRGPSADRMAHNSTSSRRRNQRSTALEVVCVRLRKTQRIIATSGANPSTAVPARCCGSSTPYQSAGAITGVGALSGARYRPECGPDHIRAEVRRCAAEVDRSIERAFCAATPDRPALELPVLGGRESRRDTVVQPTRQVSWGLEAATLRGGPLKKGVRHRHGIRRSSRSARGV